MDIKREPLPVRAGKKLFPVHQDKTFIVTGAAGGLGMSVVRRLLAEGGRVAAWDVRDDALTEAAQKWSSDRVKTFTSDLADPAAVKATFEASTQWLGALDGVVNNAAIVRRGAGPTEIGRDDWELSYAVNLYAPYDIATMAIRHMVAAKTHGAVVNVASEAGKKGHTQSLAYSATKAAMISMTRVLAEAVAEQDVNVNCVCPGALDTDMLRRAAANYARLASSTQDKIFPQLISEQLNRHVQPDEVSAVISFLLSDEAMAIRGQAINTDGGGTPY